jgi:preprotein translocase subunit SecB
MTQTVDIAGRPLFFPASMDTDAAGVILARPIEQIAPLVASIAPNQLLPFVRRLINGTSKRRRELRWSEVNRQRLEVAKLCIDRALRESIEA